MAAFEGNDDDKIDLTTCSVCLEQMVVPKYLPCLHSFCQTCIAAFAAHCTSDLKNQHNIECPVCRTELVYDGTISPDVWASKLPTNFLIVELLDRAKLDNKVKWCITCERLEQTAEATNFCIECAELLCEGCLK